MRTIAICSGKGGVGKTTISVNLAILLSQIGKKVILVDADIAMANIGIVLGIERTPISIHNVLSGENRIEDAIYEGPAKLNYVPSGLSLEGTKKVDMNKFAPAIAQLEKNVDYLIIDCPPGLEQYNQQILKSSREVIIIVTPDPPSLADGLKVRQFASRMGLKIAGIVVNRFRQTPDEVKLADIETLLGNKIIAIIPDDPEVRRSVERQSPLALGNQGTPAGLALRKLAAAVTGENLSGAEQRKTGFFSSILEAIFGKKRNQ